MAENTKKYFVKRVADNAIIRNPMTEVEFKNLPKGEYVEVTEAAHKASLKPRKNK